MSEHASLPDRIDLRQIIAKTALGIITNGIGWLVVYLAFLQPQVDKFKVETKLITDQVNQIPILTKQAVANTSQLENSAALLSAQIGELKDKSDDLMRAIARLRGQMQQANDINEARLSITPSYSFKDSKAERSGSNDIDIYFIIQNNGKSMFWVRLEKIIVSSMPVEDEDPKYHLVAGKDFIVTSLGGQGSVLPSNWRAVGPSIRLKNSTYKNQELYYSVRYKFRTDESAVRAFSIPLGLSLPNPELISLSEASDGTSGRLRF